MIYICNFHVLSHLLLIYICKLHWNLSKHKVLFDPKTNSYSSVEKALHVTKKQNEALKVKVLNEPEQKQLHLTTVDNSSWKRTMEPPQNVLTRPKQESRDDVVRSQKDKVPHKYGVIKTFKLCVRTF